MNTVLEDVRKVIGGDMIDPHFDQELCMHINSVLVGLRQIGVKTGTNIVNDETLWSELVPNIINVESIKTWLGLKVRLIFDPPTSSYVSGAIEENLRELEFRIQLEVDT